MYNGKQEKKNTRIAMQMYQRSKERPRISLLSVCHPHFTPLLTRLDGRLQLALNSEVGYVGGSSNVDVSIKVDESVPGIERNGLSGVVGVLDHALYVVATSTGADSLERSSPDLGAEGTTEELAESYGGVVDDDIGVGVFAALVIGELDGEDEGRITGDGWSRKCGGEESSGRSNDHGGLHIENWCVVGRLSE